MTGLYNSTVSSRGKLILSLVPQQNTVVPVDHDHVCISEETGTASFSVSPLIIEIPDNNEKTSRNSSPAPSLTELQVS